MKSNFKKNEKLILSTCGVNEGVVKKYLIKKGYINFKFVKSDQSDLIIMTNRVTGKTDNVSSPNDLTNCFDKYKGQDTFKVARNGVLLSVVRKIND